jgi:hypothetical protein
VVGILFHIGEKKIPGSVGEPTADGRSPVRTLSDESKVQGRGPADPPLGNFGLWTWDFGLIRGTGHAERKLPVGQVVPAGPVKTGPGGTGPSHLT